MASVRTMLRRCRRSCPSRTGDIIGSELLDERAVAVGELELVGAGLQRHLEHERAHDLRGLRQAAAQHARREEHLLLGQAGLGERLRSGATARGRRR